MLYGPYRCLQVSWESTPPSRWTAVHPGPGHILHFHPPSSLWSRAFPLKVPVPSRDCGNAPGASVCPLPSNHVFISTCFMTFVEYLQLGLGPQILPTVPNFATVVTEGGLTPTIPTGQRNNSDRASAHYSHPRCSAPLMTTITPLPVWQTWQHDPPSALFGPGQAPSASTQTRVHKGAVANSTPL